MLLIMYIYIYIYGQFLDATLMAALHNVVIKATAYQKSEVKWI